MKDLLEKINLIQLIAVMSLGISLISSTFSGGEELAKAISVGLIGFISGTVIGKKE